MTRTLTLALTAAVLIAPLAFLIAVRLLTEDELDGVAVDTTPLVVPATARTIDDRTGVEVALTWAPGASLLAPAWSGTVTAIHAHPGDAIVSGTPLLAIAGVDRIAVATPQPLYRPLSRGDSGPDVEQLNQLLGALGYIDDLRTRPDLFSAVTESAVEDLESALGIDAPTGRFDPALVVWLPVEPFVLGDLLATVAAPAPSPGSTLATSLPGLLSATLTSQNPSRSLSLDPAVDYVLTVDGEEFAVDPSTASVVPGDSPRLAGVALAMPAAASGPFGSAGSGPRETVTGTVVRRTPLDTAAVPATSVVTNARGALCVWTVSADGYQPVAVTVDSSLAGVTSVTGGLAAGAEVLANPAAVLAEPSCPLQ